MMRRIQVGQSMLGKEHPSKETSWKCGTEFTIFPWQRTKNARKTSCIWQSVAAFSLLTQCICMNDVKLPPQLEMTAQSDQLEKIPDSCLTDHEMAVIEILHPRHGSKIESDEVNAHILVKNYEMGLDAGCAAIFLNTHYRYKSCAAEIKVTLSSIRPGMSVIDISLLDSNDREVGIMSSTTFISQLNHAPWSDWKILSDWSRSPSLFNAVYQNARPYKLLVSYGTEAFQDSLKTLAATAISIGGVDGVKMFGPQHLNQDFTSANSRIFNQRKGAGLWLWKPYLINQSLHTLSEGDLLMYADAQLTFVSSATPLFDIAEAEELGIVSFGMAQHKEYVYTKEEVLFALNCTEECRFSGQRYLIRKS
mmetsp:Transcript_33981/g.106498  ORF Transcript_33981/g.106498 Transcript_33981/m.106498 type:complete len:364 (-) Transcript_33981:410-1501(-)